VLIYAEKTGAGTSWNLITDSEDAMRSIEAKRKGSKDFLWKETNGIYAARFPTTATVRENLYRLSMRCCDLQFKITQSNHEITIEYYEN
jgi:hypothetical protein